MGLVWTGIFTSMNGCFFGIHVGKYTMGPTGCSKKLGQKKRRPKSDVIWTYLFGDCWVGISFSKIHGNTME